jgi:hypothetical protein
MRPERKAEFSPAVIEFKMSKFHVSVALWLETWRWNIFVLYRYHTRKLFATVNKFVIIQSYNGPVERSAYVIYCSGSIRVDR